MAENPATWGEAEKVIDAAITSATRARLAGVIGWSMAKQIAEALREADLLASEQLTARAQAADAYARKAADLHRENLQLRDENSLLRGITRVTGAIQEEGDR